MGLYLVLLIAAPNIHRHALIVGANDGGPSQERLRFAESDAAKVAAVLTELGSVPETNVRLLQQPTPSQLLDALDQLAQDLATKQSVVFYFYYSGHARASALSLGGDELP